MRTGFKTLRICNYGHRYYKSSDCNICPKCEKERNTNQVFLQTLAAPARRALENNIIISIQQLSQFRETDILQLHGIGKNSISILRKTLNQNKLTFKK